MYDATIAAWDSKYAYGRARPSDVDSSLETAIPNPVSPAYPSEHATVAGAASAVLAYLFPDDADTFATLRHQAARSRELAGVQYPSDTTAGLVLGRQVANLVIDRAHHDGSELPWSGSLLDGGHEILALAHIPCTTAAAVMERCGVNKGRLVS